jgi:hypothetical protein
MFICYPHPIKHNPNTCVVQQKTRFPRISTHNHIYFSTYMDNPDFSLIPVFPERYHVRPSADRARHFAHIVRHCHQVFAKTDSSKHMIASGFNHVFDLVHIQTDPAYFLFQAYVLRFRRQHAFRS